MLRLRVFLTFLLVVLTVMGGVHGYLYLRLVRDTALPQPWGELVGVGLLLVVLGIPLSFLATRLLDKNRARLLVVPMYIWLGFAFLTFALLLTVDLAGALLSLLLSITGVFPASGDPARDLLVWRVLAGGIVTTTTITTFLSIWWGLTRINIRRLSIPIRGLPGEMDGFTIAHLSDLHLDLIHGREWLRAVVRKTNTLEPDLVAITGDLAEGSVSQFGEDVAPLGDLRAPAGAYFVTGNHEYFHDLDGWMESLAALGIRVLRNERVTVGRVEAGFELAGVDDHEGRRLGDGQGPDVKRALEGWDRIRPVILLAHQPRIIQEASEEGVDLVLCGHTHGGQIWPFSYLVYLQQPYVRGLKYRDGTWLYLSSGTGFWGPPMRLGTTAEIAVITLRAAER